MSRCSFGSDVRLRLAADALAELGVAVHLAHSLEVQFPTGGSKDERDAELASLLRMGRLPEAWIAPPTTQEIDTGVGGASGQIGALRSNVKCPVHAVLAGCGFRCPMRDLLGAGGQKLHLGARPTGLSGRTHLPMCAEVRAGLQPRPDSARFGPTRPDAA